MNEHGGKLSYKQFEEKWPAHYTRKTRSQLYSKNRIVKDKAKRELEKLKVQVAAAAATRGTAAAKKVVSHVQTTLIPAAASTGVLEGKRRSPQTEKGRQYQAQMQVAGKRRRLQ